MEINLERLTGDCVCGRKHQLAVKNIFIEPNASRHLEELLRPYRHPVFICDSRTKAAAQEALEKFFHMGNTIELRGEGIHADNSHVSYISEHLGNEADVLIAVGSGTVHDLTRFTAFRRGIPFFSMPTAASVDGFVSTVAAMTWDGLKKTFPAKSPLYVLADTNIFSRAPYRLTASGISDLMGKYTALTDWKIAHLVTGEYFCPRIYDLEIRAVQEVEGILDEIKSGKKECMEKLMYALLLSGLAMQMIGNSRPASGAEHHISHLWEMCVINDPIDALHGEKVSAGLILVLEKYRDIRSAIESGRCRVVDHTDFETDLLQKTFGKKGLYEGILEENGENILKSVDLKKLGNCLPGIAAELRKLPAPEAMKAKLKSAGCVTSMQELNLPPDRRELTLKLSPYVRRRLTLMRLSKLLQI